MGESYVECLVARKSGAENTVIKGLVYGLTTVCLIGGVIFTPILLIPAVALLIICFTLLKNLDLEFEYLYMDKEISIDKIISKAKRKKVRVLDLNKMELMAPEKSHEFDSYKSRNVKVFDYSSKDDSDSIYLMVYRDESGEALIRFNPNPEMIDAIRTVMPRKVMNY